MAPPPRNVKPHRAKKTKKSNRKSPKTRKKVKEEEKIELEGIARYVYHKSFKPKPTEN